MICSKSKFLQAACFEGWPEGQEKVVRLPDVHSKKAFQMYMNWAYTNELDVDTTAPNYIPFIEFIELYHLGEVMDDGRLRSTTIRALSEHILAGKMFSIKLGGLICLATSSTSSLKKWLADAMVSLTAPSDFEMVSKFLPAEITRQAAIQLMHRKSKPGIDEAGFKERWLDYVEPVADA